MTTRLLEHIALFGILAVAVCSTILWQVNFLTSTLLFFGLPSAYLIWLRPKNFKKALVGAVVLGVVLAFSFDYVAEFNKAWGWASSTNLTLPFEFFGVVSLDILVWYFLWVFLIVAYYEYFIERDRTTRISPHAPWVVLAGILLAILVVGMSKVAPDIITISYAYAKLGTITFILCGLLFLKNPKLIPKVLHLLPFFIVLYLAYEITALYTNLWSFPGAYLGFVTIGDLVFPLEEMVVWVMASSVIVATYYEFCIDDSK